MEEDIKVVIVVVMVVLGLQNNYRTGSNQFYIDGGGGGCGFAQTTGPVGEQSRW